MLDYLGKFTSARFIKSPIFIVGGSRSGTIVLLKAMGRHARILSTPSEDPFITDVGGMVHSLEFCSEVEKQYYLETLRVSQAYIYDLLRRLALESALGQHYGLKQLIKLAVVNKVNPLGKRYWCTKTFPGKNVAQGLKRLYPEARFIWILRNGINVVYSRCKFPAFRDQSFEEHCRHWAGTIERFSYLLELPGAVVVHQEELVDDPDRVFRRIFEEFRIDYDPGPTEYALTHHVHPLGDESTTKGIDIKKTLSERPPPYQEWTQEQMRMFKDICGEAMRLAGYKIEF
ncbi:MAG: hypothetical protein BMS9Abin08_0024 [Gammaproteobacteria bacterium]|nr:MAG: hypothetical protein BMS9Abin08_0024 [Gammaproteobacteria bacterium]